MAPTRSLLQRSLSGFGILLAFASILGLGLGTRSAAAEYAQRNIRINAVCPAVIRTPMVESVIRQGAATEAQIAREIGKFLMNGGLFRGSKPVMWSVVEKTALAEAEIEYHDHVSDTVHVRFPVLKSAGGKLDGASVVIWTTTPWTMPGNRALAYGPEIAYALVEVAAVGEGSKARVGEKMVLAKELVDSVAETANFTPSHLADLAAADLEGAIAAHPLRGQGYEFDVRLLPGAFVTADAGTGFVHIAPGHGADDYELGVTNGVEVPDTVAEDGPPPQ